MLKDGVTPDLITTFLLADVAHLLQNNLVSMECHCGQEDNLI